jgi:WS/DGAT/MGAT family acyltransferase
VFEQWNDGLRALNEWQQNLLDPRSQVRSMSEFATALQVALPAALRQPAKMPWNKPISGDRATSWSEMSFQEVRGIRSALGGTVNDVMLTIIGGALGRYLHDRGEHLEGRTVRFMIPVNVRKEDEKGALGNRVSMMLPEIPVGIADPAERLGAVRQEMERLKSRHQADAFESLVRLSTNLPAALHALAGINGVPPGGANLVCTNVPGPMIPLYSVGHRMVAHYPLVPLAGDMGIGVGITSFDKALYVGFMCDPRVAADVDALGRYCDAEFAALRDEAGVPVSDLPEITARRPASNGHAPAGVTDTAAAEAATPAIAR